MQDPLNKYNSYDLIRIESDIVLVKNFASPDRDELCSVKDLEEFFDACRARWGSNWNLAKVMIVIRESEID